MRENCDLAKNNEIMWEGNRFRLTGGAEVTLQGDSTPVKNQLGGKRPAGRKLNLARRLLKRFSREAIA